MSTIERAIEKLSKSGADDGLSNLLESTELVSNVDDEPKGHDVVDHSFGGSGDRNSGVPSKQVCLSGWLKAYGMLPSNHSRNRIMEEYRMIKRPLLKYVDGDGADKIHNSNLIMVASALPGEGKTFTALNLAISIAMEQGRTAILVDADFSRISLEKIVGKDRKGFGDYLAGEVASVDEVLLDTDVHDLKIVASGTPHAYATELLAGSKMSSFIVDINNKFPDNIIIFDTPPVLISSEAGTLSKEVGQVVFVVEAEQSSKDKLSEALSVFDPSQTVGLVLNKCHIKYKSGYYGSFES